MRLSKELAAKCLALAADRGGRAAASGSGPWVLTVPGWHPTRLNDLLHAHHMKAARLKKADRQVIASEVLAAGVPAATGKRRVSLRIILGPRMRGGDPDCYWKSLLDALTACGALANDSREWVETPPVEYERGKQKATIITLEDMGNGREQWDAAGQEGRRRGQNDLDQRRAV